VNAVARALASRHNEPNVERLYAGESSMR